MDSTKTQKLKHKNPCYPFFKYFKDQNKKVSIEEIWGIWDFIPLRLEGLSSRKQSATNAGWGGGICRKKKKPKLYLLVMEMRTISVSVEITVESPQSLGIKLPYDPTLASWHIPKGRNSRTETHVLHGHCHSAHSN